MEKLDEIQLEDNVGYILDVETSDTGRNMGHAIAFYKDSSGITIRDQNAGQNTVSDLAALSTLYGTIMEAELNKYNTQYQEVKNHKRDFLDADAVRYRVWAVFKLTPKQ